MLLSRVLWLELLPPQHRLRVDADAETKGGAALAGNPLLMQAGTARARRVDADATGTPVAP